TTIAGLASNYGSADGTNSTARFSASGCTVAADTNGNVYVADTGNFTIRKITPVGTNWAGTTIAGLAGHAGSADGTNSDARFALSRIAAGTDGNLYVADGGNGTIRKVTPIGTNWVVTTIAGLAGSIGDIDGTNSSATFGEPTGIAVDAAGSVYVS